MSTASNYHPLPHQLAGHMVHIEGSALNAVPMFLTIRDLITGEEIANCVKVEIICDVSERQSIAHLTLIDFTNPLPPDKKRTRATVDVPCTFALSAEVQSLSARPQRE